MGRCDVRVDVELTMHCARQLSQSNNLDQRPLLQVTASQWQRGNVIPITNDDDSSEDDNNGNENGDNYFNDDDDDDVPK